MSSHEKYDAFISYRHCLPDSEIALRLQKKLESFRLPKAVADKAGRQRLNSVFLDETELSVADDLSVELNSALLNSDYLIAICSPEYVKSKWCMRELNTFLEFKGRKNILLVLADGEPENAFPEIMLYEDVYSSDPYGKIKTSRLYKEPLAADCRGESSKERKGKIDIAVIRLISAIMGIRYDDLQQRHRKEIQARNRNRTLLAFSLLGLIIAICLFFIFMIAGKNKEIALQNEIITQKYADSLAVTSDNLLREGNRRAAVYAARLALPDEMTDNYSELASKALVNAMGLYSFPNEFSAGDDITLPCAAGSFSLSPDGSYCCVNGLDGTRYVIDLRTSEVKYTYVLNGDSYFCFDGELGFIFQTETGSYSYYDLSSGNITELLTGNAIICSNMYGPGYTLTSDGIVDFRIGTDSVYKFNVYDIIPNPGSSFDVNVLFTADSNRVIINIIAYDNKTSYIYDVNINNGTAVPVQLPHRGMVLSLSADENSIVWTYSDEPTRIYRKDLNTNATTNADIHEDPGNLAASGDYVVAFDQNKLYLLDSNLDIVTTKILGQAITECVTSGGSTILTEGTSGFHFIKNGKYAFNKVEFSSNNALSWNRSYRNGVFYVAISGENIISTFTIQQSDYIAAYYGTPEHLSVPYSDDPQVVALKRLVLEHNSGLDESQIYQVIPCENADVFLVQLNNGTIYICDKNTGNTIKTIYSSNGYARCFYFDSKREYYYVGTSSIDVYDKDFRSLFQLPDCYLIGIDPETGFPVAVKYSDNNAHYYLIRPVTYSELINAADKYLNGYVPDEKIKEKYGL